MRKQGGDVRVQIRVKRLESQVDLTHSNRDWEPLES